jgi:hypothetical protein
MPILCVPGQLLDAEVQAVQHVGVTADLLAALST